MVNKWTLLGVYANAIYCTLCRKPLPINHGGMEQVNQHVRGETLKSFSDAKFSSSQSRFFKSASSVQLAKPVHIQVTQAEGLWAFKLAEQTRVSEVVMESIDYFIVCFRVRHLKNSLLGTQRCLMLFAMILVLQIWRRYQKTLMHLLVALHYY